MNIAHIDIVAPLTDVVFRCNHKRTVQQYEAEDPCPIPVTQTDKCQYNVSSMTPKCSIFYTAQ